MDPILYFTCGRYDFECIKKHMMQDFCSDYTRIPVAHDKNPCLIIPSPMELSQLALMIQGSTFNRTNISHPKFKKHLEK